MPKRVLILGGTRDALVLAEKLASLGHDVTTSLAGVTANPVVPAGNLRVGGFGGVEGLVHFARDFDLIADATHPFAARISAHAAAAAASLCIPCLRLERLAWTPSAGDKWTSAADAESAAEAIPHNSRTLLTIGRKELAPFFARPDLAGAARLIEWPSLAIPGNWRIIQARPPFTFEAEIRLLRAEAITVLVTKNAGGALTKNKLAAARALGLPVLMIERPVKPPAPVFSTVEDLIAAMA